MKIEKHVLQIIALFCIQLIILMPLNFVQAISISNIQTQNVGASSATITWETDEVANGKIRYGPSTSLGFTERHSTYIFDHSLTLNGLNSETEYFFEVEAQNINGDTLVTNNNGQYYKFTTMDVTPPDKVQNLNLLSFDHYETRFEWDAVQATDVDVYLVYRDNVLITNTTDRFYQDNSLSPGITYKFKVAAVDNAGNKGVDSDALFVTTPQLDLQKPVITNIKIQEILDNQATISWITNEPSTSAVHFGTNQLNFLAKEHAYVTNHTITIDGLIRDLTYKFVVEACDSEDNCDNSTEDSLTAGLDITPPGINTAIPRVVNTQSIDIRGTVEAGASVKLFVNNMNFAARALDGSETSSGQFEFRSVRLQAENVIKIVASDVENNKFEETFRVTVDAEKPTVVLDEIPSVFNDENLTIVGTVSEPVDINFFLRFGTQDRPPEVVDLRVVNSTNEISIEWNATGNRDDFSHYIVYREDVGPLAISEQLSDSFYTDDAVNKGEKYTYWVTQVNKFGKESLKSQPITVHLNEGELGIPKPAPIDARLIEQPTESQQVNTTFTQSLLLNRDDGEYTLLIEVVDRGGNRVLIEKIITLDTKPPEIKIENPPSGTLIFENYANEIDVRGKTEPFARVFLFIDRAPTGDLNGTFDVSGLANEIQNIPTADFAANCRLRIGSFRECRNSADHSTTADSEGNFVFDNVDVTNFLSAGFDLDEQNAVELGSFKSLHDDKEATLVFVAEDKAGLRYAIDHKIRVGTCWSGNQTWGIRPLTQYQSPTFISPQRLADNNEIINFYFKYEYIGHDQKARVTNVNIDRACSGLEILGQKRFNISCQIMPGGGQTVVNEDGDVSYTTIKLNRIRGMDQFLKADWDDFFGAVSNELTFPMKARITYQYEDELGNTKTSVQTTCQEVTYVMDNSLIDPRDILPDFLLYDFVEFLETSMATLNDVNDALTQVLEYAVLACVSSFLLRLATQIVRRFEVFTVEQTFAASKLLEVIGGDVVEDASAIFTGAKKEDREYCDNVAKEIIEAHDLGEKEAPDAWAKLKLEYFSDADLRTCFPAIAESWESEARFYNWYRWSCDRVFGHKTPSPWTKNLDNEDIKVKLEQGQTCEQDGSITGAVARAHKCADIIEDKYSGAAIDPDESDVCFDVQVGNAREFALFQRAKEPISGTSIYEASWIKGDGTRRFIYVIRDTENAYFHDKPRSCSQICRTEDAHNNIEGPTPPNQYNSDEGIPKSEEPIAQWGCMTTNACKNLIEVGVSGDEDGEGAVFATSQGFTRDCFYKADDLYEGRWDLPNELENPDSVSGNPDETFECCCINANPQVGDVYYRFTDTNVYESPVSGDPRAGPTTRKKNAFADENGNVPGKFEDMEWSYRYWKNEYKTQAIGDEDTTHDEYHPYRYIEGRDQSVCLGYNHAIYDGEDGDQSLIVMDSRQDFWAAFQCVNIGGMQNRIQMMNNLMGALSACLIDIRETGTSDAAACKEIFSRYVCSTIWDLINVMANSCSPLSINNVVDEEDEFFSFVRGGVGSVYESLGDVSSEIGAEYGNVELNNLIGSGAGEIARKVCLGAFGYDWDFNLESVMDAAYAQTFASLVQVPTSTREYLTVDPTSEKARHDYRASWIINPGCNIENYRVQLACVTQNEIARNNDIRCDVDSHRSGSTCDCLNSNLDSERLENFYSSSGRARQNQLIQESESKITESFYRYDHLKFTLTPDARLSGDARGSCFPPGHEDGVFYASIRDQTAGDFTACAVDAVSGTFDCSGGVTFFNKRGTANIVNVEVNGERPTDNLVDVFVGDPLDVTVDIRKSTDSPLKCLMIQLDKRDGINPDDIAPEFIPIEADGLQTYGPYELMESIDFTSASATPESSEILDCIPYDTGACEGISPGSIFRTIEPRSNPRSITKTLHLFDNTGGWLIISRDSDDKIKVDNGQDKIVGYDPSPFKSWWDDTYGLPVVDLDSNRLQTIIDSRAFERTGSRLKELKLRITVPGVGAGSRTWKLKMKVIDPARDDEDGETIEASNCASVSFEDEAMTYQGQKQEREITLRVQREAQSLEAPDVYIDRGSFTVDSSVLRVPIEVEHHQEISSINYYIRRPGETNGGDLTDNDLEYDFGDREPVTNQECKYIEEAERFTCDFKFSQRFIERAIGSDAAGDYIFVVEAYSEGRRNRGEDSVTFTVP